MHGKKKMGTCSKKLAWKPIGINGCWSFDPLSCYFMFVWNALQYGVPQFFFCFLQRFSSKVSTPMTKHRLVIEFSLVHDQAS